jgi:Peptidase MA superfamily
MLISRAKWVRFSLILSVSALLAPFAQPVALAQETSEIVVDSSTAESNFPDDMRFELAATVAGDVERVDLVYEQAHVETYELLPADFEQSGDHVTASAVADFATYFVPAGIDLTFHWVITFGDEDIAETDSAVVTWLDNRFEWDFTAGAGVEIYSYDRSDDLVAFVVETANEAVGELTALYDPPSVLPIRIWLYESSDDFAGTQAANSQEWAAGAAYPGLQVILAVIPEESESEVLRIIPHEISHQILFQATLNPFNSPATWIDEGLAVLAQTGGKDHYERLVENAYDDDNLLSLRGLISSFPYDPSEATLAYGESYLITQFILNEYGVDAIQAIIAAYRNGASHDDVLREALGMTIEELEQAWLGQFASVETGELIA